MGVPSGPYRTLDPFSMTSQSDVLSSSGSGHPENSLVVFLGLCQISYLECQECEDFFQITQCMHFLFLNYQSFSQPKELSTRYHEFIFSMGNELALIRASSFSEFF